MACGSEASQAELFFFNISYSYRGRYYASFKLIQFQLIPLATCSYVYAPYQVLKKCGIKGPEPSAFFGNYRLQKKMVGSCDAEVYIALHVGKTAAMYICMFFSHTAATYSGQVILVAALLLHILLYLVISELAMYMQGVLHFFEFLLKHHGPISG